MLIREEYVFLFIIFYAGSNFFFNIYILKPSFKKGVPGA